MRRRNRGLTLTELLVVTAVVTILTSFVSPLLIRAQRSARGRACSSNLRQIYHGAALLANKNFGKLPACVTPAADANSEVKKDGWWFRRISSTLYPDKDPLTVPSQLFRPEHSIFRCPESRDQYNCDWAPPDSSVRRSKVHNSAYWPFILSGWDAQENWPLDRVYDDNYGYNNMGFVYNGVREVPNPDSNTNPSAQDYVPTSGVPFARYYKGGGPVVSGRYQTRKIDGPNYQPHIGEYSEVPDGARTILVMDYIKADAQPFPGLDDLFGFALRHGDRGNALFVDGHAEVYSKPHLLAHMGDTDKATPLGRIHWAVRKP